MKKIVLSLALLVPCSVMMAAKPKPNPADYTVTVHVIESQGGTGAAYQHLEVIIDGQYMELQGQGYSNGRPGVLALGEYKAMVTKGVNPPDHPNGHDLFEAYDFLFSDGTTRYYEVVGVGEPVPGFVSTSSHP